jgi:hypothetical protein
MTMVTKKTAAGQAKGKKLKLKKETIKDLGSKKSGAVKGGLRRQPDPTDTCYACSVSCIVC